MVSEKAQEEPGLSPLQGGNEATVLQLREATWEAKIPQLPISTSRGPVRSQTPTSIWHKEAVLPLLCRSSVRENQLRQKVYIRYRVSIVQVPNVIHSLFQEPENLKINKRQSIAVNIKMTEMLHLSDKDFKATMIKANRNTSKTNEDNRSTQQKIESLSKEIQDIKKN